MSVTKCIVIGNSGVGKSSLSNYFSSGALADGHHIPTIGIEFYSRKIMVNEKNLNLHIWDTAGQERFRSIVKSYFRDAVGALICFSILDRSSFESVGQHIKDLEENGHKYVQRILVGTYSDKKNERAVSFDEAKSLANRLGIEYFEVSSKTGKSIDDCFNRLAHKISDAYDNGLLPYDVDVDYFELETEPVDKSYKRWYCCGAL